MSKVIDGKAFAANLRQDIAARVAKLKQEHSFVPGLAVVLVGEDPASEVYVRNKGRQTVEVGMQSFEHKLAADTSETDLLALIDRLNVDDAVNGILVQLPLPEHIDKDKVINAIAEDKDVDGFHLANVARLWMGAEGVVPCTPLGCLMMLKDQLGELSGLNALIVGRSNIVGKPMAALLLAENCTVTIAHSRSRDLENLCRNADILVAAVGRPEMIPGSWVKPGATVIADDDCLSSAQHAATGLPPAWHHDAELRQLTDHSPRLCVSSTRRFFARPGAYMLFAIGRFSPQATVVNASGRMPFFTRYSRTAAERRSDSCWL